MNQADVVGYVGAIFVFATFWMKTMIPLRALGLPAIFSSSATDIWPALTRPWCFIFCCCRSISCGSIKCCN